MKKCVVLITGQKTRLELSSKIKYLIKPLSKKYNVTVVLSLSDTNNFTSKEKYKNNIKYNECNIEKELNGIPYYINTIVYPDLKINKCLFSMYDKIDRGEEFKINRANNHIRQYYTLFDSLSIIKNLDPYILIRARDDLMLTKELSCNKIFLKKYIITPKENNWGGINDKFAIVPKDALETYLTKPFQIYQTYNDNSRIIHNPEQFLKYVYSKHEIKLITCNINLKIMNQ